MATRAERLTPPQLFALVFGAVYVLVGIAGLFVAQSFTGGSTDDKLIIFPVNHLHNIVHLAIGAAFLVASRSVTAARMANVAIGATYLLVAVLGFTGIELMHDLLNIHSGSSADNFLHLGTGVLALAFGMSTVERARQPVGA